MSITSLETIISFAKRRGFVFQSSELYGGFGAAYDFGPLGVLLKNNIKNAWWDWMLKEQENIVGLDSAVLMSPKVWEASGHLSAGFADELVECRKCRKRFREDFIEGEKCPECGGGLTEARKFNLMMKTFVGPVEDEAAVVYLRPETAQGIYVNFENVRQTQRLKLPFGIAQIGKAFRNEITPKDFLYRTREFEQMEMQWFCRPSGGKTTRTDEERGADARQWGSDEWFEYWLGERLKWYESLGMNMDNIRTYEVPKEKLAHYAKRAVDIEYRFPFGWKEIEGIHNRGDWDLSNHAKHSGNDLSYQDPETGERFVPHIVETSVGVDRSLLAFFIDAYREVEGGRTTTTESVKEKEVVLTLHHTLAPIQVAVLPLVKNNEEIVAKAKEIFSELKKYFFVQYDESGSVGRRYRRQDEIGTPFCVTVDHQTREDGTVTVRDRDTMKQERVAITDLRAYLKSYFDPS